MEICFLTTTLPEKKTCCDVAVFEIGQTSKGNKHDLISLKQREFSIFARCYCFFLGGPMSAMSVFNGGGAVDVTTEWSTWMSQEVREKVSKWIITPIINPISM